MSRELPEGWATIKLQNLVTVRKGKKPFILQAELSQNFVPYLDIQAIEKNEVIRYADKDSSRLCSEKDLLVVWDGARSGWVGLGREGAIGSTIMALEPRIKERKFLYYWLQTKFEFINGNTRGTGIPHVDPDVFWNLEVPLAPLNEQRRIVAKLEKLLEKVESSKIQLEEISSILKRFRQSVLAASCSGHLTADWRDQKSNPKEWKSKELFEISERIQIGPFGTQLHKSDYISKGIPLINPTHIQDYKIKNDLEFSISKKKCKELDKYILQENDVILGRRGEMGRCALISQKESGWLCGTGSLFVRPKSSINPIFLFLILRNGETKAFLENESKGTTMNNLNLEILKRVPVPIPPLPEQHEIVRRVEELFALADRIEARYQKAKVQVDKLTQSILAKAFRGELVPQDLTDEPSTELLEKIKEKPYGSEVKNRKLDNSKRIFKIRDKLHVGDK